MKNTLRKVTVTLAVLLAVAAAAIYAKKVHDHVGHSDFDIYYRAASQAKQGDWPGIYDFKFSGGTPFRYGPPSLLLFAPFARVSHRTARDAWYALQLFCFAAGFWYLHLAVRRTRIERIPHAVHHDSLVTALAFLFSLRFMLDCFMIGQITSVMFLAFALSLRAWLERENGSTSAWLYVPTILKAGPAAFYGLFLSDRSPRSWKEASSALVGALVLSVVLVVIFRWSIVGGLDLWRDWFRVIMADSTYFDASHYGSQSVKSALLRLTHGDWGGVTGGATRAVLTGTAAHRIYLGSAFVGCGGVALLWLTRRPKHRPGRMLFFALGFFPYFWFMPETFKYTLPLLAFPVAALLCSPLGVLEVAALVMSAALLSLAGLDIVGERLFFAIQKASLPAAALVFLGLVLARRAWKESEFRGA